MSVPARPVRAVRRRDHASRRGRRLMRSTIPSMTGAASSAAIAPLRGAVPITQAMEVLQIGYLHAVVAAARCSLADPRPDRGVDWLVTHESASHQSDPEADLKVQLKSTQGVNIPVKGSSFAFTLENEHLRKLAVPTPTVTRLLVVMLQPTNVERWIKGSHNLMALRHCCYWVNLAGHPISGKDKTTVRVETSHVFDDMALCNIMRTIGQKGVPR
jgi:hypothetical protein